MFANPTENATLYSNILADSFYTEENPISRLNSIFFAFSARNIYLMLIKKTIQSSAQLLVHVFSELFWVEVQPNNSLNEKS